MLVLKLRKPRGQLQSLRPHFLEVRFTFGGAVLGRLQGLFQQGPLGLVLCNLGGLRRSDLGLILIDWFIQRGDYGALSFTRGRNCGGIAALSVLTPEERGLVFGRVMEGRSYEELSQIYGPSAAALRKRYERARKKLALALSESELDEQKEVVP